jgi:hypothetical protein
MIIKREKGIHRLHYDKYLYNVLEIWRESSEQNIDMVKSGCI